MPVFVDSRSSLFFAPQSGEAHGLAGRPPPGNQCRGDHGDAHRQQHRRARTIQSWQSCRQHLDSGRPGSVGKVSAPPRLQSSMRTFRVRYSVLIAV